MKPSALEQTKMVPFGALYHQELYRLRALWITIGGTILPWALAQNVTEMPVWQCCGAGTIFCGSGSDFSESFASTPAPAPAPAPTPAPVLHAIRYFMTKENGISRQ